ncbi:MAG: SagB/ThcOx family dehydrogenase [Ignavibacteria bacterium]|nr:SagB/ThcOx family dehydrogenase [Ignavibacteria bacterium]
MKTHKLLNRILMTIVVLLITTSFQVRNYKSNTMCPGMNSQKIKLPETRLTSDISVEEALLIRRSIREFKNEAITVQDVSQILWAAYGITEERSSPSFLRGGLRTAPSAGALYPLEIYLVAGKVTGLKAGIYKYISPDHSLELVSEGDIRKDLAAAALNQEFLEIAPASLMYSAVYSRMTQKYGNRGRERYVCMDLGHSAQNVYLQACALGLGTCAVGAFTDDMVSIVMQLPEDEEPLYIMPVGKY